ncbi:hypothetical protein CEXT_134381 [Caerostris extrusa]|uniref:Uncharacterized protein n=1 Tax=Caerostris extrusa TaxID=172846 RepID=A0AAV4Y9N4_CAEEX|nr:hypothetical protein CEXT_134381 [Caerostris extrusa]
MEEFSQTGPEGSKIEKSVGKIYLLPSSLVDDYNLHQDFDSNSPLTYLQEKHTSQSSCDIWWQVVNPFILQPNCCSRDLLQQQSRDAKGNDLALRGNCWTTLMLQKFERVPGPQKGTFRFLDF